MTGDELAHEIFGAAIEVHRPLGPGLLESAHEKCLTHELSIRGPRFERQKPVAVVYKDAELDCGHCIDLLTEVRIAVEL